LVATAAFAVDLGANVFGLVVPAQGQSGTDASEDITSSLSFERLRLSGYGEAGDGAFGGQLRVDGSGMTIKDAFAFWKPIDQLKVLIGGNTDGMYGKEGVTGWGFNGNPYDGGVALGGGKIWGGFGYTKTRVAFYGGYGGDALHLNITPVDMLAINLAIPFEAGVKTEDVFKSFFGQVDASLGFGNIAITYQAEEDAGEAFVYYGGSFGDLSLDIGFGYNMKDGAQPIGVGAGLKYATDAFGVKFRVVANLGGDKLGTQVLADVLPYFSLGDNMVAYVNVGITMNAPDSGDTEFDWLFNPYIRIGEEWGAQFLVGVQVNSEKNGDLTKWAIPIAIMVNF